MKKSVKTWISVILAILFVDITSLSARTVPINTDNQNDVRLVLDSVNYTNILPKNFRKTSDLSILKDSKGLNLKGLDKLNISGSSQFSASNLPLMIKAIGTTMPIVDFDLRQESHGFINEYAVSWSDVKNNANAGLSKGQVLLDEAKKLSSIKLNEPVTFYKHPEIKIKAEKVQNESTLAKANNLGYVRITVRDGGIPTDDMVDFFIETVKFQSPNSWLHFHCKQGIGRTSTFMIMYDMMKNYKSCTADDIIKRQLALADFKDSTVNSFNNNERLSFLTSFYEYCKKNGDSYKVKWSDWKKSSEGKSTASISNVSEANDSYVKNPVVPTHLNVVSQNSMSDGERTMVATLQGVVNSHCSSQIYTLNSSQPDYKVWLEDLKNNYGISYTIISDPWELLHMYKNYINGYVLYSRKTSKDPSINNACSLAALNNSIAIDDTMESKVKQNGITNIKGDCRNTDELWAFQNLWNKGLNHSMVMELAPDKASPLRDYAIMAKALVFYEDSIHDTSLREKIFSSMKGNSICFGWGPDEFINVSTASKCGVSMIAADWSYNLSVLSAFPSMPVKRKQPLKIPKEKDVHYVTFIMSDGDNQQWNLGTNYGSKKWFGYPGMDKLNLGWSMSPSIYFTAPTVFKMYYKSLTKGNGDNNFIVSPSGNGYMYPSKFDKSKLNNYIDTLNSYMQKVDEKYVAILDDSAFYNNGLWNKFTERSNIQGLFYLDYHRHDNYKGKIVWSNNKPIVSCRDLLWKGLEEEDELVKNINDRIQAGEVNVSNPEAYTFVYVHVWSKETKDVEEVQRKLKQNPKVRIVTPEIFMELIKKNVKPI